LRPPPRTASSSDTPLWTNPSTTGTPRAAVGERHVLQQHDAVRDAAQLQVLLASRMIVQNQHGSATTGKERASDT
jgi:hypothetical protein